MYDDIRTWFHEHPIYRRSLWVLLSVAMVTILVALATGTVGTSPEHVTAGPQLTVPSIPLDGQVPDQSDPFAPVSTAPVASSSTSTPTAASTVPGATTVTTAPTEAPTTLPDTLPGRNDPGSSPTTLSPLPTSTTTTTTTAPVTSVDSPLCNAATLSELAAQSLGRAGHQGLAGQIQPMAVIWKESLVRLSLVTKGGLQGQALYLLSVIKDTLAQHADVPLDEIVQLFNDLSPKYTPAAVAMYANLKKLCPQMT